MTTVPQSRPKMSLKRPPVPVIIAIVLVITVIGTLIVPRLVARPADPLANGTAVPVTQGALVAGINATGRIEPVRESALAFAVSSGRVTEILVQAGDPVQAGQPLVRLDARQRAAEVAAAEAALAQARADVQALEEGATPEQIAAARAQLEVAQGSLLQTRGSVSAVDLQAAEATLNEARERLRMLLAGAKSEELTRAETALAEAQANLNRQATALSAAKEDARRLVEQRANALRDAQTAFANARDNLASVEADGKDPRTGLRLTDAGKREYQATYVNAERAMQNADLALAQARVDYENAIQAELTGLADGQARVTRAQADLSALQRGPDADEIAAARAAVVRAEAQLAQLRGDQRQGALAASEANVLAAQARLDELLADPRASDLSRAQARVAQAEAQLQLARIQLDDLTLTAPFDGVVATVDVAIGEQIGQSAPITLIDLTRYKVEVTVDEIDVTRVAVGQEVEILVDALGAPALQGTIVRIAPQASSTQNVTAYTVEVEVTPGDRPVRPGMTATATIIADRRENAISVPTGALQTVDGVTTVQVVTTDANGNRTVAVRTVQTGATLSDRTEIVSGLQAGEQVLIPAAE